MKSIQLVHCDVCCWIGVSPVKRVLKMCGHDYPIVCKKCGACAVTPEFSERLLPECDTCFVARGGTIVMSGDEIPDGATMVKYVRREKKPSTLF